MKQSIIFNKDFRNLSFRELVQKVSEDEKKRLQLVKKNPSK